MAYGLQELFALLELSDPIGLHLCLIFVQQLVSITQAPLAPNASYKRLQRFRWQ